MKKICRRGFTLIELLVVVLIISILAAVAMPQYTKAVEKSKAAKVLSMAKTLQESVDTYVLYNGYPSSGGVLNLSGTANRKMLNNHFQIQNAPMRRKGLHAAAYMIFPDYYFYVTCSKNYCLVQVEDNKPYQEQLYTVSWYRYKDDYLPKNTWNKGGCAYKADSSVAKSLCDYFVSNSLLSNGTWSISKRTR